MSETDELLNIVDSKDNIIGQTTRGEAYQKGLLHRAVNVIIFNSQKKILFQQRSSKKLKFPLYWDLSVGEHVKPGEDYLQAAKRGLKEELNIKTRLRLVRDLHHQQTGYDERNKINDNELAKTFIGFYDGEVKIDKEEVNQMHFFAVKEIEEMVSSNNYKFTSWFLDEWKYLSPKLKQLLQL